MRSTTATPLPIDDVLASICTAAGSGAVVVRAAPGAGKTTRVPPALLAAGVAGRGRVVVLEPRRIAARAAAARIAAEQGWQLGREVGYQVRGDRVGGRDTRVWIVTEGILLRWLQADPFLDDVGVVVLDEFHERSVHTDLALALCRQVRREARDDLRIVVMSATLDPGPVAAYLDDCPVIDAPGRAYPVDVRYASADAARLEPRVSRAIDEALSIGAGDVLVFLPGVGEIQRVGDLVAPGLRDRADVLPLYGDLAPDEQDRVFRPGARRRVILATNVAETSITVPTVDVVVDAGLVRRQRFDPAAQLDRLVLERISRASADQRAGRAGRTRAGHCLRLWSEHEHTRLDGADPPEILRVDPAPTLLALLEWGVSDPTSFPFLEPPSAASMRAAMTALARIGAVDGSGLTASGRVLARLPLSPRLGRLAVEGARAGAGAQAALAAALLAERDVLRRDDAASARREASDCDVCDRVELVSERGRLRDSGAARLARDAARQIRDQLRREGVEDTPAAPDWRAALRRAITRAWPDRVCRRRAAGDARAVMSGGLGVVLTEESAVVDGELLVAVELQAPRPGERAEGRVRIATRVERAWLDELGTTTEEVVVWDAGAGRASTRRRTLFDGLVLSEQVVSAGDPNAIAAALAGAAAADPERALGLDDAERRRVIERLRFLARVAPDAGVPDLDADGLRALLPAACVGRRTLAELARVPLQELLASALPWSVWAALDREAPDRVEVPSGSRVRVDYSDPDAPVLAVRIQELFGLADTPTIANGRVPLTIHLLAPNHRPQQVTRDLRSFWANTYPEVRRELRARYPKHAWPEDPWNALPQARPSRRRP